MLYLHSVRKQRTTSTETNRNKALFGVSPRQIHLHTPETLVPMREACVLARDMLDLCCAMAQPGVTTDAIDAAVHAAIIEAGACPSPLNYHGFPKVEAYSSRCFGHAGLQARTYALLM